MYFRVEVRSVGDTWGVQMTHGTEAKAMAFAHSFVQTQSRMGHAYEARVVEVHSCQDMGVVRAIVVEPTSQG